MNLLDLKVGDRVTLTALYDDEKGGQSVTRMPIDDNDINIYAYKRHQIVGLLPLIFFQYIGDTIYQYSSCDLDYDYLTQSYTIKDIQIEKKKYKLESGWGTSSALYLVQLFDNNVSFINWLNENPFEVKQ
tara:strand:- start:56 stop:445 length:390 start_codon:yes stop_codon:yes gene_type:complete